jgi:hypothetical protein
MTETSTLDGPSALTESNLTFNANSSNLNALMLRGIQNDYESRNLSKVSCCFQMGFIIWEAIPLSPVQFSNYRAVGLGDTTRRPDLNLNALLLYNKIAYQGNNFPVIAELFSYNMAGETGRLCRLKKEAQSWKENRSESTIKTSMISWNF